MKAVSVDWDYLLEDTLWPGLSLAAAIMAVGFGIWYYGSQQTIYEANTVHQSEVHEDYDALVYRRRLLARYHRRYNQFQSLGFVGRESRLDWIETIRTVARDLDLPNVTYSLEPQLEVIGPIAYAFPGTEIQVFLSRLELDLGLVHELDLLRFFDRLELEAPGLMKVDRCDLSRQGAADQKLNADTNINASCSLMMFSVITSDISVAEAES